MAALPSTIDNPFPSAVKPQSEALVAVEQSRAVAEIQAAMTVAKRFPRNQMEAMDRILNACTRPSLAESALYTYARGGTEISGPSIRLAEALAQAWGNIKTSVRELEQRDGMSTVQTIAWDLESGYQSDKVFQVKHVRDTKKGSYAITDGRDIYEMVANQGSRRLRACILAVIPGDVIEAAVKQCETTLKTKAEVTPERLKALVEKFAEFGVTKEQIEARIQRHLEAMTPAQMVDLGKKYNSLKDGMSTPADWFDVAPAQTTGEAPQAPTGGQSRTADVIAKRRAKQDPPPTEGGQAPAEPKAQSGSPFQSEETAMLAVDSAPDRATALEILDACRGTTFEKNIAKAVDNAFPPQE